MFNFTKRNETLNLLKNMSIECIYILMYLWTGFKEGIPLNGLIEWIIWDIPLPAIRRWVLGQQQKIKVSICSCLLSTVSGFFFLFPCFFLQFWSEQRAERKRCGSARRRGPWVTWWLRMGGGGGVVEGDPPHFHSLLLLFSRSLHWMSPPL